VQLPLDHAPVGVSGVEQSLSRRAELDDFQTEPIERVLQLLDVPGLQLDPPRRELRSCP
jgi:hypothetical protein